MAFEFEIEWEEDGLQIGENGAKDEEPHFNKVRDKSGIGDATEGVIKGDEACTEEGAEIFK